MNKIIFILIIIMMCTFNVDAKNNLKDKRSLKTPAVKADLKTPETNYKTKEYKFKAYKLCYNYAYYARYLFGEIHSSHLGKIVMRLVFISHAGIPSSIVYNVDQFFKGIRDGYEKADTEIKMGDPIMGGYDIHE